MPPSPPFSHIQTGCGDFKRARKVFVSYDQEVNWTLQCPNLSGLKLFFDISKFCSSVFLIFEIGKETCSKVFCALIYFVWFPTIPFASWDRGDQSDVLYTISSRSFSLMYSARVLVLPPRHDNLWRSVNIDIQLAGLWHEREPCLHFNSLWSDYALTLGQLSTVPKKILYLTWS